MVSNCPPDPGREGEGILFGECGLVFIGLVHSTKSAVTGCVSAGDAQGRGARSADRPRPGEAGSVFSGKPAACFTAFRGVADRKVPQAPRGRGPNRPPSLSVFSLRPLRLGDSHLAVP
jgi:hypothetical protein